MICKHIADSVLKESKLIFCTQMVSSISIKYE